MQKSLQERQKCLDDVSCTEIFERLGINFTFEYEKQKPESVDAAMGRVKEMTSRFTIKKLLDLAYDLDD